MSTLASASATASTARSASSTASAADAITTESSAAAKAAAAALVALARDLVAEKKTEEEEEQEFSTDVLRIPKLSALDRCLADPSQPIGARMRASYHSKQIYQLEGADDTTKARVVAMLCRELVNHAHGKLMRHEFAYVLGQLRDERAVPTLCAVLDDAGDDCISRHESAEALGAIGAAGGIPTLRRNFELESNDVEIRETCRIALDFIAWQLSGDDKEYNAPAACACMLSAYDSRDPAPPHPAHEPLSHEQVGDILRDSSRPLFERYRAMFSLRNKGGAKAARELGRSLVEDESSALFRHEVAFVLGQLQHVDGLDFLVRALEREGEHEFVRHEAAEAIGAIEGDWERSEAVLRRFMENDHELIVRQSCEVALDGADYFRLYSQQVGGGDDEEEEQEGEIGEGEGESSAAAAAAEESQEAADEKKANLTFSSVKGTTKASGNATAACGDGARKVLAFHFNVKE